MLRLAFCLLVCVTVAQAFSFCGSTRCPLYEDCCCGASLSNCCECNVSVYSYNRTVGSVIGAIISLVVVTIFIILCCCCIPGCIMHRRRQPGHVYYQQGVGTTAIHSGGQQGMMYPVGGYPTVAPYPAGYPPPQPQGPAPYPPNAAPYPPNAAPYPPNAAPYPPNAAPYYPPNTNPDVAQPPPSYQSAVPPADNTYQSLMPPDTTKPSPDAPAPRQSDAVYDNTVYETPDN